MMSRQCSNEEAGHRCKSFGEFHVARGATSRNGKYACGQHVAAAIREVLGPRGADFGLAATVQWAGPQD